MIYGCGRTRALPRLTSIGRFDGKVVASEACSSGVCAKGSVCRQGIGIDVEYAPAPTRRFSKSIHPNQVVPTGIDTITDGDPASRCSEARVAVRHSAPVNNVSVNDPRNVRCRK